MKLTRTGTVLVASSNWAAMASRAGKSTTYSTQPTRTCSPVTACSSRSIPLDNTGKVVKDFPSGGGPLGLDALPNGHVLVTQPNRNRVAELDSKGQVVWQTDVPEPTSATRTVNGHTLVTSRERQTVVEFD